MDLVEGRDYVIDRRAVKKAVKRMRRIVKRYEKANAEKLAIKGRCKGESTTQRYRYNGVCQCYELGRL